MPGFQDAMKTFFGGASNYQPKPPGQGNPNQGGNLPGGGAMPNQPNQGGGNQGVVNNAQGGGSQGQNTGVDNSGQQAVNPLDAYAGLFNTAAKKPGQQGMEDEAPHFQLAPEVITKAAGSIDFLSSIPKELQEKLSVEGGPDLQTMMEVINHAARQAYTNSLSHLSPLIDKFHDVREQHGQKHLGKHIRNQLTENTVESLPQANHPAIKEGLKLVSRSIASQHPDAPPQWVAEQAYNYFISIAQALAPEKFSGNAGNGRASGQGAETLEDFDWDSYLDGKSSDQRSNF